VREQVQVASKENEGEEHLTASGYTWFIIINIFKNVFPLI
jgi:hypothetical protein